MTIYYFCPDILMPSAGIRILYRHVEVLNQHGFKASILHDVPGFKVPDVPDVPIAYFDASPVQAGDWVVMPEPFPHKWEALKQLKIRRMMIALNWDFIFDPPDVKSDWRSFGVEHVISHSPFIADFISWSMRLPVSVFTWGINPDLYFPTAQKRGEIVFIGRKQQRMQALHKALASRDPRFVSNITWTMLHGLSEVDYAAAVRGAFIFINLSPAEGLPCSLLEAMRCHTLVAGYNSIGGQRELVGSGPQQNAILAETLDYATLAMRLEPVLLGMLSGDVTPWSKILENAAKTSAFYHREAEAQSIIRIWEAVQR